MTATAYAPDGRQVPGWIGVDFDGTLAEYHGWTPELGAPVPAMLDRVKAWLAAGLEVRIVTARVSVPNPVQRAIQKELITTWCVEHLNHVLEITCRKDLAMLELWDDRAVTVEENTGRVIRHPTGDPQPRRTPCPCRPCSCGCGAPAVTIVSPGQEGGPSDG